MTPEVIAKVVDDVWSTTLGMSLTPSESPPGADAQAEGHTMTGCVHIVGAWDGAVLLSCPASLVRTAAAMMFGKDVAALTSADLEDTLGELTNIIGGNLRSLLPTPTQLSLLVLTEGNDYRVRVHRARMLSEMTFACGGEQFLVRIIEQSGG